MLESSLVSVEREHYCVSLFLCRFISLNVQKKLTSCSRVLLDKPTAVITKPQDYCRFQLSTPGPGATRSLYSVQSQPLYRIRSNIILAPPSSNCRSFPLRFPATSTMYFLFLPSVYFAQHIRSPCIISRRLLLTMYNAFSIPPLTADCNVNLIGEKKINDRDNTLTLNLRGRNHLGFFLPPPFRNY
jgi:hypothetical protein